MAIRPNPRPVREQVSVGSASAIGARSRTPRDDRIQALHAAGWSLRQIGVEVAISAEQVRRILVKQADNHEAARDSRRAEILGELSGLERLAALAAARLRQLRRELRALEEELEAGELDRLLGL